MKSLFFLAVVALSPSAFANATPKEESTSAGLLRPADWLKAQVKPKYRAGHTLPPLTRYGWDMDDTVRITLAEDWGYALEFGVAGESQVDNALNKPESREARLLALAISDPKRYPLSVVSTRELPKLNVPTEVWTRDAKGSFLNA